jgi:hypothetical protein
MTTSAQNSRQILSQSGSAAVPGHSFLGSYTTGMYLAGTNQLGFSTAGAAAMTIAASGNVGIGTASPSTKLDVVGVAIVRAAESSGTALLLSADTTNANGVSISSTFLTGGYGPLKFLTTSTEAMRIDTSGNVGIGASSNLDRLTVAGGIKSTGAINGGAITANSTFLDNNTGARLLSYGPNTTTNGAFYFYQGKSDNSSGQTAMTIGAAGDVAIGGTLNTGTYRWLTITGPTTSGGGIVQVQNSDASVTANFFCNNLAGYIGMGTNTPFLFRINSNEVARLDTSGNLLVGQTSSGLGQKFSVTSTGTWNSFLYIPNGQQGIGITNTSGTSSYTAMTYYNNGTTYSFCGSITVSGTTTAFNTSSDYRMKENVEPMTNGLATVSALKPIVYDWIGTKERGEGFLAHELQEVIPLAVTGDKDAVDEDGKMKPQSVDYSKIVVYLVAAIQELSAKNDALMARVATLEGK